MLLLTKSLLVLTWWSLTEMERGISLYLFRARYRGKLESEARIDDPPPIHMPPDHSHLHQMDQAVISSSCITFAQLHCCNRSRKHSWEIHFSVYNTHKLFSKRQFAVWATDHCLKYVGGSGIVHFFFSTFLLLFNLLSFPLVMTTHTDMAGPPHPMETVQFLIKNKAWTQAPRSKPPAAAGQSRSETKLCNWDPSLLPIGLISASLLRWIKIQSRSFLDVQDVLWRRKRKSDPSVTWGKKITCGKPSLRAEISNRENATGGEEICFMIRNYLNFSADGRLGVFEGTYEARENSRKQELQL